MGRCTDVGGPNGKNYRPRFRRISRAAWLTSLTWWFPGSVIRTDPAASTFTSTTTTNDIDYRATNYKQRISYQKLQIEASLPLSSLPPTGISLKQFQIHRADISGSWMLNTHFSCVLNTYILSRSYSQCLSGSSILMRNDECYRGFSLTRS